MLTWCGVPSTSDGKWRDNAGATVTPSDMCIYGIPYEAGQTAISGQAEAPFAIRRLDTFDSWRAHDLGDLSTVKVADAGDANINRANPTSGLKAAETTMRRLFPNTKCLVVLGGDHSVSAAVLQARYYSNKTNSKPPAVIHLDAHSDTWDDDAGASYPSHAGWVRWVLNQGYAEHVHQFGVRALGPDDLDDEHLTNRTIHHVPFVSQPTSPEQPVHLSVDLDVVDPAFCPGVAYREPGGWTPYFLLRTIEMIVAERNVIGVDIVELTPALDRDDLSVRLAHRCVLAVMRGIKRKQLG